MKFLMDNRGGVFLTVVAVLAGILLGLAVYGSRQYAEAILGGEGNVTLTNNPHNFAAGSSGVEATTEDRVCVFCHTPHNASMDSSLLNGPLWNHELSTATYSSWTPGQISNSHTPYVSNVGFVNVLTTQPDQPDGSSRMCMGCHDGTIGIGSVVSGADITMDTSGDCLEGNGRLSDSGSCASLVITDLRLKHSVSIPMNQQLLDDSALACDGSQTTKLSYPWDGDSPLADTVFLRPTATRYPWPAGDAGVSSDLPASKYNSNYSYGVQCSTCHDPHYWKVNSGSVGFKFLVTSTLSDLCIACHDQCS